MKWTGLYCVCYRLKAVLGNREWIANLLHHWFSSHRGGYWGADARPRMKSVSQRFWEQLLDFREVSPDIVDKHRLKSCLLVEKTKNTWTFIFLFYFFLYSSEIGSFLRCSVNSKGIDWSSILTLKKTDELRLTEQAAHLVGEQPAFIRTAATENLI